MATVRLRFHRLCGKRANRNRLLQFQARCQAPAISLRFDDGRNARDFVSPRNAAGTFNFLPRIGAQSSLVRHIASMPQIMAYKTFSQSSDERATEKRTRWKLHLRNLRTLLWQK